MLVTQTSPARLCLKPVAYMSKTSSASGRSFGSSSCFSLSLLGRYREHVVQISIHSPAMCQWITATRIILWVSLAAMNDGARSVQTSCTISPHQTSDCLVSRSQSVTGVAATLGCQGTRSPCCRWGAFVQIRRRRTSRRKELRGTYVSDVKVSIDHGRWRLLDSGKKAGKGRQRGKVKEGRAGEDGN